MDRSRISPEGLALIDFALDTRDYEWVNEILDKYSVYKGDLKRCCDCGEYKPITNFKQVNNKKRKAFCKICMKKRKKGAISNGKNVFET